MKNHCQTFKILLFDTKRSQCVSIQSFNVIFMVILIKMGLQKISERDGFILDLSALPLFFIVRDVNYNLSDFQDLNHIFNNTPIMYLFLKYSLISAETSGLLDSIKEMIPIINKVLIIVLNSKLFKMIWQLYCQSSQSGTIRKMTINVTPQMTQLVIS